MSTEVQETLEPKIHEGDCMVKGHIVRGHMCVRYDVDFSSIYKSGTK